MIVIFLGGLGAVACGKGENAGIEEAKKQAEAEQKTKETKGEVAKTIKPPVPGHTMLPCAQVIDAAKFQQVLGEKEPITVVDGKDPDAPASCALKRGGKKLSDAEQKAMIKQNGRLGVLPGDEICTITTYCWTIEDADRFRTKCQSDKTKSIDDTMGFPACVWIVPTGADDVKHFQLFDDDTKCIFDVRAGPSNVDNDLIGKCAKAAHDLIGPEEIAVKPGGAAQGSAAGSGT
jgi:hypothetical protein